MLKLIRIFAAGALFAGSSWAGTATTTMPVSATLVAACSVSATAVAFPAYTPGSGTASTANGTLSVKCTKNSPFTVALNAGATTGGTIAQRLMASGANHVQYNLYTSAAFSTVFGDGTSGSATVGGTGAGLATALQFTVYGQLPDSIANQAVSPGAYSDTITVTVSY